MNESRLNAAMTTLEGARKYAEKSRLAWLVSRYAHPSVLDVSLCEAYAEAANAEAEAWNRYTEARIDAMAEVLRGGMEVSA